jgi:hypothetical protein
VYPYVLDVKVVGGGAAVCDATEDGDAAVV